MDFLPSLAEIAGSRPFVCVHKFNFLTHLHRQSTAPTGRAYGVSVPAPAFLRQPGLCPGSVGGRRRKRFKSAAAGFESILRATARKDVGRETTSKQTHATVFRPASRFTMPG